MYIYDSIKTAQTVLGRVLSWLQHLGSTSTDTQTCRHTDVQTHRRTDVQTYRRTDAETHILHRDIET